MTERLASFADCLALDAAFASPRRLRTAVPVRTTSCSSAMQDAASLLSNASRLRCAPFAAREVANRHCTYAPLASSAAASGTASVASRSASAIIIRLELELADDHRIAL